jgi:hypothetical protein
VKKGVAALGECEWPAEVQRNRLTVSLFHLPVY